MQKLLLLALKGLLTILPIALTFYLIFWLGSSVENIARPLLAEIFYFPGLGIIVTCFLLIVLGIAMNAYLVSSLVRAVQNWIERLPIVKTLYGAINDAVELFKLSKEQDQKRAVLVEIKADCHVLGFITGEKATKLLFENEERTAVYIPMSYQIGGYTLYVTPSQISPLDIDVETAMRIAVTGGNSIKQEKRE